VTLPDVEVPGPDEPLIAAGTRGRSALTIVIFRVGALPISFATSVITSRLLEPTGRGAYVLGLLTVTLAATLVGNVGVAITHEIGKADAHARPIVRDGILMSFLLGIVGGLMLLPIDLTLADRTFRIVTLAIVALPAMLVTQAVSGALLGLGRLRLWNLVQFLGPATTLFGMLVFVVEFKKGVTGAICGWAAAQFVSAAVALWGSRSIWSPAGWFGLPTERLRSMLMLSLRFGAANVVSLLNYRIELIILEHLRGLNAVGEYSLSTSLGELLWLVSSALAIAAVAPAIELDHRAAGQMVARTIRHALVATATLGLALALLGYLFVPVVFGAAFRPSVVPLMILIPGIVAFSPGSTLGVYFSMRQGRTRYPVAISGISLVSTGVAALILIPPFGVIGAALATTLGYVGAMGLGLAWFSRSSKLTIGALVPRASDLNAYRELVGAMVHR
jgi:O-antigen/teichoic acid export membrane protein